MLIKTRTVFPMEFRKAVLYLFLTLLFTFFLNHSAFAVDEIQLGKLILPNKIVVTNPYLDTCNTKSECGAVHKLVHPGIDYRARKPLEAKSPVNGTIVHTIYKGKKYAPQKDKYGTIVVKIRGAEQSYFMLAHMSQSFVIVGDKIKVGHILGVTGKKGTIFPHLHVEFRQGNSSFQRLAPYFKNKQQAKKSGNSSPTLAVKN